MAGGAGLLEDLEAAASSGVVGAQQAVARRRLEGGRRVGGRARGAGIGRARGQGGGQGEGGEEETEGHGHPMRILSVPSKA